MMAFANPPKEISPMSGAFFILAILLAGCLGVEQIHAQTKDQKDPSKEKKFFIPDFKLRPKENPESFVPQAKDPKGHSRDKKYFIPDFSKRLKEKKAKTGDVQISLAWNNKNDIDLHVICPSGEKIFYGQRKSRCNGMLDIDMNVVYSQASNQPIENIFWPAGKAPNGRYRILVHHYRNHGTVDTRDPTRFTIRLLTHGEEKNFDGMVVFNNRSQRLVLVHEFEIQGDKVTHHNVKPGQNGNFNPADSGKVLLQTNGVLTANSPLLNGKPSSSFRRNLVAGYSYKIDLESASFDTYLLIRQNGRIVASDDDGGEQLNSSLRFVPRQTGLYEIIASSYDATARGPFTLTVSQNKR